MDEVNDRAAFGLRDGWELCGVEVDEVWWRYLAIGGQAGAALLLDRICGTAECDDRERNRIAQALNECFSDRGVTTWPVGYVGAAPPVPPRRAVRIVLDPAAPDVRRRAAEARIRSTMATRQAALLHLTAARLMQVSGHLTYAGRARERARAAQARLRVTSEAEAG